jgi:chlorite dismutase
MSEYLETLKKVQSELKSKAEKFSELRAKNKYTLKNIAFSLQKSQKSHEKIENTLNSLEPNVEKTSFQALLQVEPYNLNNTYSANAADLFFFDHSNIPVYHILT